MGNLMNSTNIVYFGMESGNLASSRLKDGKGTTFSFTLPASPLN